MRLSRGKPLHTFPDHALRQRQSEGGRTMKPLNAASILPDDDTKGTLVGRVWLPQAKGPAVVAVRADGVYDVTQGFATVSALAELPNPANALREAAGVR